MHTLSERAVELLSQAGWSEGRVVDSSTSVRLLLDAEFEVFPVVRAFLERFGDLAIQNPSAVPPAAEDWHFNVTKALKEGASYRRVAQYMRRLDTDLTPIGYAFGGYMILMMDAHGRVYGGYDQFFAQVGDSGVDAINALCDGRKLEPLEAPEIPS